MIFESTIHEVKQMETNTYVDDIICDNMLLVISPWLTKTTIRHWTYEMGRFNLTPLKKKQHACFIGSDTIGDCLVFSIQYNTAARALNIT